MIKNTRLMNGNKVYHKGKIKTVDGILRGHVCLLEDVRIINGESKYSDWIDLNEIEFIPFQEIKNSQSELDIKIKFNRFYKNGTIDGVYFQYKENGIEIQMNIFEYVNDVQNFVFLLKNSQ